MKKFHLKKGKKEMCIFLDATTLDCDTRPFFLFFFNETCIKFLLNLKLNFNFQSWGVGQVKLLFLAANFHSQSYILNNKWDQTNF